jgi:hypothetical protein
MRGIITITLKISHSNPNKNADLTPVDALCYFYAAANILLPG